jgi:hypothetical protein
MNQTEEVTETSIEKFAFDGDELDVVRTEDGDVAVPLRRLCEVLGVDEEAQRQKVRAAPWATTSMIKAVGADGRVREMLCLHRRTIPMWAASINIGKVRDEIRAKLVRYQCEAADVLADHFLGRRGAQAPVIDDAVIERIVTKTINIVVPPLLGAVNVHVIGVITDDPEEGGPIGRPRASREILSPLRDYARLLTGEAAGQRWRAAFRDGDRELRHVTGHNDRAWGRLPADRLPGAVKRADEMLRVARLVADARTNAC